LDLPIVPLGRTVAVVGDHKTPCIHVNTVAESQWKFCFYISVDHILKAVVLDHDLTKLIVEHLENRHLENTNCKPVRNVGTNFEYSQKCKGTLFSTTRLIMMMIMRIKKEKG
jgi:hypothetical protein